LDQNHTHPTDCTRFIACDNGVATDTPCADCDEDEEKCDGSPFLRWDEKANHCAWPIDTKCGVQPTKATTTTAQPTNATTTTAPPVVEKPELDCKTLNEGGVCDVTECRHCGWCEDLVSYFYRCDREDEPSDPKDWVNQKGHWKLEVCDGHLWWNPDVKPVNHTVGGTCDNWANLTEEVRKAYKHDDKCVAKRHLCEWGQDEDKPCCEEYWYKDNGQTERTNMTCPTTKDENGEPEELLIWDRVSETCRSCENVAGCALQAGVCKKLA